MSLENSCLKTNAGQVWSCSYLQENVIIALIVTKQEQDYWDLSL